MGGFPGETKAEKKRRKNLESLLEATEAFATIAESIGGFVAKLREQGFTDEQAHEIAAATFAKAMRTPD